jgi:hypothetical protein
MLIFFKPSNDSCGGSIGHAAGDVNIYKLFGKDETWCHHSDLTCNGTKICEFFLTVACLKVIFAIKLLRRI